MRRAERAARAELRSLGVSTSTSMLAAAAVDLAERLDAKPGDRAAAMLVRELRLVLTQLRAPVGGGDVDGSVDDVEAFLARVSSSAFDEGD